MASPTDRFLELLDAVPRPDDAEFLYDASTPDGALRLRNLERYLALMARIRPDVALIAEAPGYRGMTATGIPFLSLRELTARPGVVTGSPEGDGFEAPLAPAREWEASSRVVWAALADWRGPLPVSWPIYPHHPFVAGDPHTNRAPRQAEVRSGVPVALELLRIFGITTVVAVGRKAQAGLALAGVEAEAVRHPAQGGAALFTRQLAGLDERLRGGS